MSTMITVRRMNAGDKAWLKSEASRAGVSMEEFVRRLIHEGRERARIRVKPSEAFRRHFGPENGIELPLRGDFGYKPVRFRGGE